VPAEPLELLKHQFSEMKYIHDTREADFRGLIEPVEDVSHMKEAFDYDRVKLNFALNDEKIKIKTRVCR